MANLRAGIIRTGSRPQVTRLESRTIHIWANTWTREVNATLGKNGRLDIKVKDGHATIIEITLPDNKESYKDSFTPVIRTSPELEREILKALLIRYFGDDMAKSLLITNGIKGPLLEDNK